jgi:CheY-like chemotaxis protein
VVSARRILLRAEIVAGAAQIVTHTLELDESNAFVPTEDISLPVGTEVGVQLSFPGLVLPVDLHARVAGHRDPSGPGDPGGLVLEFQFRSDGERAALAALLARVDAPAESSPPAQRAYRVLVVDDNHLIRDLFSYGVKKFFRARPGAVDVEVAEDGQVAWTMAEKAPYDLVIVDFYLPVLDGSQLVRKLRAEPRLREMPIVAISVGGVEAREACLAAGADIFLDKPLVLRDLFSTLERLTQSGAR